MRKILVVDIGGTNIKMMLSRTERRKIESGPDFTPRYLLQSARENLSDWKFDAVSVGFPAPVRNGRLLCDPKNLGKGWTRFNFEKAFKKPVRLIGFYTSALIEAGSTSAPQAIRTVTTLPQAATVLPPSALHVFFPSPSAQRTPLKHSALTGRAGFSSTATAPQSLREMSQQPEARSYKNPTSPPPTASLFPESVDFPVSSLAHLRRRRMLLQSLR